MDIAFKVDLREFRACVAGVERNIPLAEAQLLTALAKSAQAKLVGGLHQFLKVRTDYLTNPKKPGGIRIDPARPGALVAEVGTRSPMMALVAEGGTKAAGKHLQSVPTQGGHGSTTNPLRGPDDLETLLRSSGKWPSKLLKRKKLGGGQFFVKRVAGFGGGDREGISDHDILFQKYGAPHAAAHPYLKLPAGREVYPSSPIQAVYIFERDTKIPVLWPLEEIVREVVDHDFYQYAAAAFERAVARQIERDKRLGGGGSATTMARDLNVSRSTVRRWQKAQRWDR